MQALAAAELATYDEVKGLLKSKAKMTEGLLLTVCTAFVSGYVSTVASSPFDVVSWLRSGCFTIRPFTLCALTVRQLVAL